MKAIIVGRIYDTETATPIGDIKGNGSEGGDYYWAAVLYRTPNGRYFMDGKGGKDSPFGELIAGSGLLALEVEDALLHAQQAGLDVATHQVTDTPGERNLDMGTIEAVVPELHLDAPLAGRAGPNNWLTVSQPGEFGYCYFHLCGIGIEYHSLTAFIEGEPTLAGSCVFASEDLAMSIILPLMNKHYREAIEQAVKVITPYLKPVETRLHLEPA